MKKKLYLFLTVLGLIFPYYFIFKFYSVNDLSTSQAIMQLFATNMSAAFNADLFVSVLASWAFMVFEGRRINMKNWRFFLPATLIGLSLCPSAFSIFP